MENKIADFWQWFQSKEAEFHNMESLGHKQEMLFELLSNELHKLSEHLSFEFSGLHEDGKREFVITANGMKSVFPIVFQLYETAPLFPNWIIVPLKPRLGREVTLSIAGKEFGFDDLYFEGRVNGSKVDLNLYLRCDLPKNVLPQIGFLMLDVILGEFDVATKIGHLDFLHLDESQIPSLTGFRELPAMVDALG